MTKPSQRLLVITTMPFKFATRPRKAALVAAQTRQVRFLGMSQSGRFGNWDEAGTWKLTPSLWVRNVEMRRPVTDIRKRTQFRNVLVTYFPAVVRMTRDALRTQADTLFVNNTAMVFLGVAHKLLRGSRLILDVNEKPGSITTIGSLATVFSGFERTVLRLVRPFVDVATVVTPGVVDDLRTLGYRNIIVVRNAPMLQWRAPYVPPVMDGDAVQAVIAGSLFENRGYELIIDALAEARKTRDVRLTVVGGGRPEYVAQLKQRAHDLGLDKAITWKGRIPGEEVSAAYLSGHIGLVIYEPGNPGNDSLSNKIVECVSTGRPVLAGDLPENRRFVTDNDCGWLCELTPVGIGAALAALPAASELAEVSQHCRNLGDQELNWEAQFAPVLDV